MLQPVHYKNNSIIFFNFLLKINLTFLNYFFPLSYQILANLVNICIGRIFASVIKRDQSFIFIGGHTKKCEQSDMKYTKPMKQNVNSRIF